MLPYWIFFGIFALGAILANAGLRPGSKNELLWLGLPILILMIGFRYFVGVDYANYLKVWNLADNFSLANFYAARSGDHVFYTMLWVLKNIDWPYWSLNLICGTIFSFGLVRFAQQQPNGWLAIAVAVPYLVIVIAMSGIRQATAMGFVFLALASFRRANVKGFVGWTVVAAMFHASAIVVLPFAGLSLTRNRFQFVLLMLLTVIGGYFVFGSTFGEYTKDYVRYTNTSSGTAYRIAMSFFPAVFYLILQRRIPLSENEKILWRNFAILAVISVPLLFIVRSSTALDRLLLYAFPLQILTLSWLPYFFLKSAEQIAVKLAILAYLSLQLFVFLSYAVNAANFLPYRSELFSGATTIVVGFGVVFMCAWGSIVAKNRAFAQSGQSTRRPIAMAPSLRAKNVASETRAIEIIGDGAS